MIDSCFNKDLEKIFSAHQIAVFLDESKEVISLLLEVKDGMTYQAYNDLGKFTYIPN